MQIEIRPMMKTDCEAVGSLHARAWLEAYRGIIHDEFLDSVSIEKRIENWQKDFEKYQHLTRLVAVLENKVVGFVVGDKEREEIPEIESELWSLYVDPDYYRRGVGEKLYYALVEEFQKQNFKNMNVWVLPANTRAVSFYQKMGGELTSFKKTVTVGEQKLPHISYLRNLNQ
ncbi:MAG: hypothetical protein CME62_14735 [Halobacteriovoraceae bacterium]|nr:hypothetical protein [Halobacteriovoraceae bacterium]|tara:strand:- start:22729 stop:23244 length:516 start_codon:yes stop_codon:yes gene_type:complete